MHWGSCNWEINWIQIVPICCIIAPLFIFSSKTGNRHTLTSTAASKKLNRTCPNIFIYGECATAAYEISRRRSISSASASVSIQITHRHTSRRPSVIFCWEIRKRVLEVWSNLCSWTPTIFPSISGLGICSTKACHTQMHWKLTDSSAPLTISKPK